MANNTNAWLLGVLCLLLGAVFTYGVFPRTVTVEVPKEVIKEVPGPIQYINVTTNGSINAITDINSYLDKAIKDAWDRELSDNDDFLTCNNVSYDNDEVTLSRVKHWGYSWIDKDNYEIAYEAKYVFDSSNDDDRCTRTNRILVHYEDGEKAKVNIIS